MTKGSADNFSPRIANRRALHDYHILNKLECGIILTGSEVKSVRHAQVSLAEGYAHIEPATMELVLYNVDIAPYKQANIGHAHDPKRPRRLLAHRREILRLFNETSAKGTTLIPLAMYFVRGRAKVEIGLAQGKHYHDKRQSIKAKEIDREIRRALSKKM